MKERIYLLREKLYSLLETKPPNDDEVIKISQELDLLILKYCLEEKDDTYISLIDSKEGWFFTDIVI